MSTSMQDVPAQPAVPGGIRAKEAQVAAVTRPSEVPAAATTLTDPKPAATATVKVSNINVTDERFHLSMIGLLGCVLHQLVQFEESQFPNGRGPISMFHTAYVPSISIQSYLKRIALYTKVSTEVLIQSVLHVHQLMQRSVNPLIVNKLNIHRLLLTSIMSTAKFFDDAHYNNSYFAFVGGVPLKELNSLEVEFLSLLNFDFFVNTETYQYFYSMVIERAIHQSGCTCLPLLHGLPKSLAVSEYQAAASSTESYPEIDLPPEEADEDVHMDASSSSLASTSDAACATAATGSGSASDGSCASAIYVPSCRSPTPVAAAATATVPVLPAQSTALVDSVRAGLDGMHMRDSAAMEDVSIATAAAARTPKYDSRHARTPTRMQAELAQAMAAHAAAAAAYPPVLSASPPSLLSSSSASSLSHASLALHAASSVGCVGDASPVSSYASSLSSLAAAHGTWSVGALSRSTTASPSPSLSCASSLAARHAHAWAHTPRQECCATPRAEEMEAEEEAEEADEEHERCEKDRRFNNWTASEHLSAVR